MLHFAEFGVVLMLFLVGLELEPRRLWAMRRPIFGGGSVQLLGSAALMLGVGLALGVDWHLALVAGLGLGLSSTAIGLGALAERNLMATRSGQGVLSVALLQDIAAIPILALVPLLAVTGAAGAADAAGGSGWLAAGKALGVIAAIVLGGRLLLRPALRWIARSDTPEIFTAAALLLVVATAALMQSVGLSMALGAFLAGVLLAESEYRRAAGDRPRALQGPAAGPVLHRRGHEHRLCRGAGPPAADGRRGAGFSGAEGRRAAGPGALDRAAAAGAAGLPDPAGPGR